MNKKKKNREFSKNRREIVEESAFSTILQYDDTINISIQIKNHAKPIATIDLFHWSTWFSREKRV